MLKINGKVAFFYRVQWDKKSKYCCHLPFHPPIFCCHSLKFLSPSLPKLITWILLSPPPPSSDTDTPQNLERALVRTEPKNGKAPGKDNVNNIILKKATGTGFCKVLARAFTISLKLGFIPHVWKVAVLCMLIKPYKLPSQTTSYRPISLLSAIMKLFERVIEKRLRKHLEDNGFFSKYQSGFRKSKSTNDHFSRLPQTIMESFNWGEHVIAAFLDVEKAFDNDWHNGLRYKIYQLDLPTKLCRWLSDFLVGR